MAATAFQKLVHDLCQAGFLETGIELEHVRACQFPLVADEQGNPSKIKTNPHPQLFCESLQSFPILQLNRACPKIEELSKGSFGTVWRFQPQTCTEIQGSCIIKIQKIDMDVQTDASRVHIRAQRMLERETATNDFVCNGSSTSMARRVSMACFSRAANSDSGATQMTLPSLRCPSPRVCKIVCSTWSHGTSFNRMLRLPLTLSDMMMLTPLNSLTNCNAVRNSMC